jgi:biotin synthase
VRTIAQAFKETGTTTVEIGGGTDPEGAGPSVLRILEVLRDEELEVWVNVGPALEEEHIREMKKMRVEAITSSFETMNPQIFREIKPGDRLEKRVNLAHMIDENDVPLISVLMAGIGESYKDRVDHLFYLNEMKNFYQLAVSWLRIVPGSPWRQNSAADASGGARTVAHRAPDNPGQVYKRERSPTSPALGHGWGQQDGSCRRILPQEGGFLHRRNLGPSRVDHIDLGEGFEITNLLPSPPADRGRWDGGGTLRPRRRWRLLEGKSGSLKGESAPSTSLLE